MKIQKTKNGGLVGTIITVVVALLIISYFGFDLRGVVESESFQKNWTFVKEILMSAWGDYIKPTGIFIYQFIKDLFPSTS